MKDITLEQAQKSANFCSGENAPKLKELSPNNVIMVRNRFLENVAFNGAESHQHIINVLLYMISFVERIS